MKRLSKDDSGVSEIIGALLLVLIVVSAASSFFLFVSYKQEQIQEQRLLETQRQNEDIEILGINPIDSNDDQRWDDFNITIASVHKSRSNLDRLDINNHPIKYFSIYRYNLSIGEYEYEENMELPLTLDAMEKVNVFVNKSNGFYEKDLTFRGNNYVEIELFTKMRNSFSRSFIPPTAIIVIEQRSLWDASSDSYEPYEILDGTESDHPGDGYIVSWEWHIENKTNNEELTFTGRKVRVDFTITDINHWINLTVTDNHGMKGTDSIEYYH